MTAAAASRRRGSAADRPRILLTGATGFLGSFLAARLAEPPSCLVRGADPQARLDEALAPLGAQGIAVAGDLAQPLDVDVRDVTHIVHCAADVAFDRPLEEARAINVLGAARVIELARRAPRLERYVHVSTAYVEGPPRNTYEQTKSEAELLVRNANLPAVIVRPSIVVGESRGGWTSSFNVLYPPLRALARGLVDRIPADPEAIVDIVPVDHVTDVIEAALAPGAPPLLPAVAGDGAPTLGALAARVCALLGRPAPLLEAGGLPPGGLEVYAPYFSVRHRFDAAPARALGLAPPPVADYLPRIVAFAESARWGKRIPALAA